MAIRVLVVEDSLTVRHRLLEVIAGDPELTVVGDCGDGQTAIELCRTLRPDVITMDMMLPVMTGVAATEYIMAYHPTPILIVSASMNRGELFRTYDALAAGAVDVLDKPRGDASDGDWERRYLSALKLVSRIKVITHPRHRLREMGTASGVPAPGPPGPLPARRGPRLVAIGASTGGPGAILDVLRAIPTGFSLPILFVLHIDEPFGTSFADWLDAQTPIRVQVARDGEPWAAAAGRVVMAPPGRHLEVRGGHVAITDAPPRHSCRPSVDILFESVARDQGAHAVAALLTGMGRDGASGLLAIRRAGGITIAQDEASSVVYGMPREAALLGAAERVLPLSAIGPAIAALDPAAGAHGAGGGK